MKELVIAGSYDEFRQECNRAGVNYKNYKYVSSAQDFRGLSEPVVHMVGRYYDNPLSSCPELTIRKAIIEYGFVTSATTSTTAPAHSDPRTLYLDTLRKAFDQLRALGAMPAVPLFTPSPAMVALMKQSPSSKQILLKARNMGMTHMTQLIRDELTPPESPQPEVLITRYEALNSTRIVLRTQSFGELSVQIADVQVGYDQVADET